MPVFQDGLSKKFVMDKSVVIVMDKKGRSLELVKESAKILGIKKYQQIPIKIRKGSVYFFLKRK